MAKKSSSGGPGVERRARVEELRKAQKSQERRKQLAFVGVAVVVVVAILIFPILKLTQKHKDQTRNPSDIGVTAAAASCDPVVIDVATGSQDHVGAGVHIDYASAPPDSGKHFEVPATITTGRAFFTLKDRPTIEQLVHNLEHGYTIAWYESSLPAAQVDDLKALATTLNHNNQYRKFIVAPWDESRGVFPGGKSFALSHWGGNKKAYRQYCGSVSGAAVQTFMNTYPATDSPEPNTP